MRDFENITLGEGKLLAPSALKARAAARSGDVMHTVAGIIVKARYFIFILFAAAVVLCFLTMGKVRVNDDLTTLLPADTETRRGITIMNEEFVAYASANIMVSNVTYDTARRLADEIAQYGHVSAVAFDDTPQHYKNSAALLSVTFDAGEEDAGVIEEMGRILELLEPFDTYTYSNIGYDFNKVVAQDVVGVMAILSVIVFAVLLLTSRSYFEVFIFLIVFVVAAVLNMGTNYWFGEISSITNSIAVILQLVLAIDYAIIFSHRYQDEAAANDDMREALVTALGKSIIEISSSSLTTVSGLVALTFMKFRLGPDLGTVLAKGIVCSLITVFLLMPGLIYLFPNALKRMQHKSFVPDLRPWGRFLTRSGLCFFIIFALILPLAIYFSGKTQYAFADTSIDEIVMSERRRNMHKITEAFDDSTPIALLVPTGDYGAEKALLAEVAEFDGIKDAMGLANIEVEEGHVLTDPYTPRMFAEMLGIDIEQARLLYMGYGAEHEQYQALFGNTDEYSVCLLDMFEYLFEKMDQGVMTLDGDMRETADSLRKTLRQGTEQLRGTNYSRLLFTATVPIEGEESIALVERIRSAAEEYYGKNSVLVIGNITVSRDLAQSYNSDSSKINLLTIAFVFVILLFTFRTVVGSCVLVFVIQGSIWINFAFPYLSGSTASFVTYMIVSAIQMGATIDYAIVIMNRYMHHKKDKPKKEAMTEAVNESFTTVMTSGTILTVAGFIVAYRVSDVYIGHIGLAVGRGALTSVILVLTVLPQMLLLFDRLIELTTLHPKKGGDTK